MITLSKYCVANLVLLQKYTQGHVGRDTFSVHFWKQQVDACKQCEIIQNASLSLGSVGEYLLLVLCANCFVHFTAAPDNYYKNLRLFHRCPSLIGTLTLHLDNLY